MPERQPSYTDLVHEVVRTATQPLTFRDLFAAVSSRRPVTTRNPEATIRGALGQSKLLASLGDGRYGYLPRLITGSVLRLPLADGVLANGHLVYTKDVMYALWPAFFEAGARQLREPVQARLPGGEEILLRLEFLRTGIWGTPLAGELQRYLATADAAAGGSLMVRVSDGEAGRCELWLEGPTRRDEQAIGARNRQLADAALALLRKSGSRELQTWDLIFALLARGAYRHEVAPDPLEGVLRADRRVAYFGLDGWLAAEALTPELRATMRRRTTMEGNLIQPKVVGQAALGVLAVVPGLEAALERVLGEAAASLSAKGLGSQEEVMDLLRSHLISSTGPTPRSEKRRQNPRR